VERTLIPGERLSSGRQRRAHPHLAPCRYRFPFLPPSGCTKSKPALSNSRGAPQPRQPACATMRRPALRLSWSAGGHCANSRNRRLSASRLSAHGNPAGMSPGFQASCHAASTWPPPTSHAILTRARGERPPS